MPRISMVIPAFNEEQHLPRLLDSIELARRRYTGKGDEIEVVVVDNASTDGTAHLARTRGCRVVRVEKRSIAAARNGGAHAAEGDVLAFVDADSQIHSETFNAIERTLASGRVIIGATGFLYDRMSLAMWMQFLPAMLILHLARLDTGVVFCRRADWQAVGGFQDDRLVAEDIQFQSAMKTLGRTRGERLVRGAAVVRKENDDASNQLGEGERRHGTACRPLRRRPFRLYQWHSTGARAGHPSDDEPPS
ncbi:MAG: glycosyltransferase [Acidobacteria bacterium]|nr:glycosyltransferase [Acidobacteriota bacterium]